MKLLQINKRMISGTELVRVYIPCILLFLYVLNIYTYHEYIALIMLVYSLGITLSQSNGKMNITRMDILVMLFIAFFYVLSLIMVQMNETTFALEVMSLYIFGKTFLFIDEIRDNLFTFMLIGSFGLVIYASLITIGGKIFEHRRFIDYWSSSSMIAATQLAAWANTVLAIMPWCFFKFSKISWFSKIISIIGLGLSINIILTTSSRVGMVLFGLMVVSIVLMAMKTRENRKRFLLIIFLVITVVIFCFKNNWFGLRDALLESNLVLRLIEKKSEDGMFASSRSEIYSYFIRHMFYYPFGGNNIRNAIGHQMHNILFDGYDRCGFIVCALLIWIFLRTVRNIQRIKKVNDHYSENDIKCLVLWSIFIGLQIFSEPVLDYGRKNYIAYIFMIIGCIEKVANNLRINGEEYD